MNPENKIDQLIGANLGIRQFIPTAIHRPGQVLMAKEWANALAAPHPATIIAQAPTGSGKSFAFGIPAAIATQLDPSKRIIWSTASKALQKQLIEKDLPTLKKIFPLLNYQVIYGRNNYLSTSRLAELEPANFDEKATREEIARLKTLIPTLQETLGDGTIEKLKWWWEKNVSEEPLHKTTLKVIRCLPKETVKKFSFYQEALKRASTSQLVIMNHHLLISLGMYKEGLWPSPNPQYFNLPKNYQPPEVTPNLMVDECHELLNIATDMTSAKTSSEAWRHWLHHIGVYAGTDRKSLEEELESLITRWLKRKPTHEGQDPTKEKDIRLAEDTLAWIEKMKELSGKTSDSCGINSEISTSINEGLLVFQKITDAMFLENTNDFLDFKKDSRSGLHWEARPFDVAPTIGKILREGAANSILSSATALFGNQEHTLLQYGLENQNDTHIIELKSPFKLRQNTKMFVATNLSPKEEGIGEFTDYVEHVVKALDGRTLVLFSSYHALKKCQEEITTKLKDTGVRILAQKPGEPAMLLAERLKLDPHCVVLATSSLWTGIDIPGPNLSAVMIHKIPFAVPDRYTKEVAAFLKKTRNINHFKDVAVPTAVNQLLQGIGRGIRREGDKVIILIGDGRLLGEAYGSEFRHALGDYDIQTVNSRGQMPSRAELRHHCELPHEPSLTR